MKTIEMLNTIKPGQKMERVKSKYSYTYGYVSFIDNVLCWDNSRNNPFQIAYDYLEDDEWELVKEPVSWQEAIQAWSDEKTFYIEYNDIKYIQYSCDPFGVLFYRSQENVLERHIGFLRKMFESGKWYIED